MSNEKRILGDSWYTNHLPNQAVNLDDLLKNKYGHFIFKIAKKIKFLKGILFFIEGKKFDIIITHPSHEGVYFLLILEALFSKRKNRVVLLEFIRQVPQSKLKKLFWPIYTKVIFGPALNKSLAKAQVLTLSEREFYSTTFKVPVERFCFIPWPLHGKAGNESETAELSRHFQPTVQLDKQYVMVSGKVNVDWETIFEVAQKSDWQLLAVCLSKHLERVNRLNKNGRAKILNDISYEAHGYYVKGATVYALCLEESDVSVGQVRLMNTNEHGVAVVATKVAGLDGYAIDGVNALLVPPNDVNAFKEAIDRLMTNPELRFKLINSAKEYLKGRTFEDYIANVVSLMQEVIAE